MQKNTNSEEKKENFSVLNGRKLAKIASNLVEMNEELKQEMNVIKELTNQMEHACRRSSVQELEAQAI